jgi:hypothetical protein
MIEVTTICGALTAFIVAGFIYVMACFRLLDELHGYYSNWRKAAALLLFALLTFLYLFVPGTLMYFLG